MFFLINKPKILSSLVLLVEFNRYDKLILVEKDSLVKDLNKIENRIRFFLRNIDLDLV